MLKDGRGFEIPDVANNELIRRLVEQRIGLKAQLALEAMFVAGTGATGKGLSAALNAISLAAVDTQTGLGATSARYTKAQTAIDDEKAKVTTQSETVSTRMTQQFAASEARVAAYKAQMEQMDTMVKMWTADR